MSSLCVLYCGKLIRTLRPKGIEFKQFATASSNIKKKKETKLTSIKTVTKDDVLKYMDTKDELKLAKSLVIPSVLKLHASTPDSLYLISNDTAKDMVKLIGDQLTGNVPVIEVNPGIGTLTKQLLSLDIKTLKLFEKSVHHVGILNSLQKEYPNKFTCTVGDFFGIWKAIYLDKIDGGNRVESLLQGIPTKSWDDGVCMKILGSITSLGFINNLILWIIFQDSFISVGRPELFITLPSACYYSVFPSPDSGQLTHLLRPTPVLFDLLFDHKLIAKMPRKDFLPWYKKDKTVNAKVKDIDSEYMYLVHIEGKKKLPCSYENLPLLWYFCKHHLSNRTNKIIPMLEQWIPGCGVWLITGQDPPGSNMESLPTADDALLPHINIFTQFRDLTPQQKLTVFKKFISWPEFQLCLFKEAVENHLTKMTSSTTSSSKEDMEQEDDHFDSQRS